MTDKTEAQRLVDALCHYEAPMNMRAHQDAAALLLKQEAAIKQLREAVLDTLERIKNSDEWWMDCPDRGGFDADKLRAAITATEGL